MPGIQGATGGDIPVGGVLKITLGTPIKVYKTALKFKISHTLRQSIKKSNQGILIL